MNFREQQGHDGTQFQMNNKQGQVGTQFQMNNTWVPITPAKFIPVRSNTVSGWPANQMSRADYQEFHIPGRDYMNEMLLHYHRPYQDPRLIGQTVQTRESSNFGGNLVNRNSVINHIADSYTQAQHYQNNGLNNNTLELLLNRNASNIATANRNLDTSINMAARNPLLPQCYPQTTSDVSYSYAAPPDIGYTEANGLLIPNRISEFTGWNTDSLLNNDIHCSVSNQLKGVFSNASYGNFFSSVTQNPEINKSGYNVFLLLF
jgi:hypothetical protein